MAETHPIQQGECLSSIAKQKGFYDYRTIYNHPANAQLKQKRPNPNILYPGDSLIIPDKQPKAAYCPTGRRHVFKVAWQPVLLRIRFQDEQGYPYANKKYNLTIQGTTFEGTTDGQGFFEQSIPAAAQGGELVLWLDDQNPNLRYECPLGLGHLDPVEELEGVQARLNNLGFHCGDVDGVNGPMTQAAVKAFQEWHGLAVDGIPGPKTQAKLKEVHGC